MDKYVLKGRVLGANGGEGIVQLSEHETHRIFHCLCEEYFMKAYNVKDKDPKKLLKKNPRYLPFKSGDVVFFVGDFIGNDKFHVTGIVGSELPSSVESFKQFVIGSVPGQGFDGFRAHKLYESLVEMAESHNKRDFIEMMSYIADCYYNNKDPLTVEKFKTLTFVKNDRRDSIMKPQQSETILSNWAYDKNRRILLCMGMTDDMIENSGYNAYDLLQQMRANPYLVASIDKSYCEMADMYTGRKLLETDVICHAIKRRLYFDVYNRGWTCTTFDFLKRQFPNILSLVEPLTKIYGVIYEEVPIYKEHDTIEDTVSIGVDKVFYLEEPYRIEKFLAEKIIKRVKDAPYYNLGEPVFSDSKLDENQREAIRIALNSNLSIITGPAGSGKTTTLKELCKNLMTHKIKYAITSLTGKAIVRARQVGGIGNRAATMHRMLYGNAKNTDFLYLIMDEATMTSNKLIYDILNAFPNDYPILLIGDVNQLQPISWGSFFFSVINSRSVPTTILTNIHRVKTSEGYEDGIIKNSSAIANWPEGEMYVFNQTTNFIVKDSTIDDIVSYIETFKKANVSPLDVTIISPYARGYGIPELNELCQLIWCDGNKMIEISDTKRWMVGARVMMLKNNYEVDVCNGQEGQIVDVSNEGVIVNFPFVQELGVESDILPDAPCELIHKGAKIIDGVEMVSYDKLVMFSFNPVKRTSFTNRDKDSDNSLDIANITLSYCITVHKSQGSEWPTVLYYMPRSANLQGGFITRPISYVSITRGSHLVILMGLTSAIAKSIAKKPNYRCEMLVDRLKHNLPRLYNYQVREFKFETPKYTTDEYYEYDDDEEW